MPAKSKPTTVRAADIDWNLPIQDGDLIRSFLGYAESSFNDWCNRHRRFCRKFPAGWKIHTEGFLVWMSSPDLDEQNADPSTQGKS